MNQRLLFVVIAICITASACSTGTSDQYAKGERAMQAKDLDLAMSCFNESIRLDPSNSAAYEKRAVIYLENGENAKAISDASEAVRINPQFAQAYYTRGRAYLQDNQTDRAASDASKVIAIDPTMVKAYVLRSASNASRDRAKMYADLDHAIKLDPTNESARVSRALERYADKDYQSSIADSSAAISKNPKNGKAYCWRGLAFRAIGKAAESEADLARAKQLDPSTSSTIRRELENDPK